MNVIVNAVLTVIFGVLAYMGVDIPEEVKAAANENVLAIAAGVTGMLAVGKVIWDRIVAARKAKAPDEHADVGNQRGFAHKGLLAIIALASAIALTAGCATFQKDLPPDVRAAAVMRDAKAVAETCLELYEADRLPPAGAQVCLQYVTMAIQQASAVHFMLATEPPSAERDSAITELLSQAEQLVKGLREAIEEVKAADKAASTATSIPREPEGWDGISSTGVFA